MTVRPGGRTGTFPRPVRAVRSILRAAVFLLILGFVAHNGGAGWVQALADLVVGAVAVGLLAPGLLLGTASLEVTGTPGDATAGAPVEIAVASSTRLRVVPVDPPGPMAFVGPARGARGADDVIVVLPRRGVYASVVLEVATAAPFGMLWWKRRLTFVLPTELHVAPRLGRAAPVPLRPGGDPGTSQRTSSTSAGVPGGVRPYRSGDPRNRVHWPASAHTAELMVREIDAEQAEQVVVEVRLPPDPDLADELAERALGTVVALQDGGSPVLLVTSEAEAEYSAPVLDRRSAGRRLAGAFAERARVGSHPAVREIPGRVEVRFVEAVRRANRPGEPENSVVLRAACAGTALTSIAACLAESEISWAVALTSGAAVVLGTIFSHLTRRRPRQFVKPILAAAALLACVAFFRSLTGQAVYDVSGVEDPLAALFAWIQGVHAFDTPARRDLVFTLAGSTTLMVVAGAQATDLGFVPYALLWSALAVTGLCGMWASQSGGGRASLRQLAASISSSAVVAFCVLVVLPAPHISGRVDFPANGAGGAAVASPGGLVGDGGSASEPARPGSPAGSSRVGGFLGFANHLDTALSPALGDEVVMRVRAERPSYWIGETFDHFDGVSWSTSDPSAGLPPGSPFVVPPFIEGLLGSDAAPTTSDLQTFYMVQSSPNLVFHADDAVEVWFPVRDLFARADDSLVSPISLGPGAIYTVRSEVAEPTAAALARSWPAGVALSPGTATALQADLELPDYDARVSALARAVTAHDRSTYAEVNSLIGWIGAHTHYSTDIPPLPPGENTVDEFLFGNRVGFCAQISSALAILLRTLGVPAREAVGYVPGPYDPITDLYDIEAKDAHAWVQVWFPGYGWQSFDPTAVVPAANPAPGATIAHEAAHLLAAVPPLPVGAVLGATGLGAALLRSWRRRPRTWAEAVTRHLERAGRHRGGRPRRVGETLSEYARALDESSGDPAAPWSAVADVVLAAAYGPAGPTPGLRAEAERLLRTARAGSSERAGGARRGGPRPQERR